MNHATPTQLTEIDTRLTQLDADIAERSTQLRALEKEAADLRYAGIILSLDMKPGDEVLVRYTSGNQDVYRFHGRDPNESKGNVLLSIKVPRPNHMGQRTIRYDDLRQGNYNGVDDIQLTPLKAVPDATRG